MNRGIIAITAVVFFPLAASAATFTVTNTNDAGAGSLAQAILDANTAPGRDDIVFNIPGDTVQIIAVNKHQLPEVTDPVKIDGYTQPGSKPNSLSIGSDAVLRIQIDGMSDGYSATEFGLVISGGGSAVRGLSITGIVARIYGKIPEDPTPLPPPSGDTLVLKGAGGNTVEGCFIGIPTTGRDERNFSYRGVRVLSPGNQIGGKAPSARNIISKHEVGVSIEATGTVIEGNYLGTDPTGTVSAGKYSGNGTGLAVLASDTRCGGIEPGAGNLISADALGVLLASTGAIVQGNRIGLPVNGAKTLDDFSTAIRITGSRNKVGGLEVGEANTIASSSEGIVVGSRRPIATTPIANTILSNIWFGGDLPIDLGDDNGTRNDLGDADLGPNNLQNFPVITKIARDDSGNVTVTGGLNSTASTEFTVQVFYDPGLGASQLIQSFTTRTDSSGAAYFQFTSSFASDNLVYGGYFTATATDASGNTSELSPFYSPVQVANLATRGFVGTGDDVLIGGFVVHRPIGFNGDYHKNVLIRGLGPSLNVNGAAFPGRLEDPVLQLRDGNGGLIAENDDWGTSPQQLQIAASGAAPTDAREAAIIASVTDNLYTAQLRGKDGTIGIGSIEIYDLDPMDPIGKQGSGRLVNLSTRGRVGSGDDVLIGGFIINGDAGQRVVLRAIGPDLTGLGVPNALDDPTLELRNGSGTLLAANDNWRDSQEQEIRDTKLAPNDDRDSAVATTLIPGFYTTIVRGAKNSPGIALVELYDLQH